MKGLKERKAKATELLQTIKSRRIEVKTKSAAAQVAQAQANTNSSNSSWGSVNNDTQDSNFADPLDAQFRRWEADEELESLKRNLSK
jgi:hypothetical protein